MLGLVFFYCFYCFTIASFMVVAKFGFSLLLAFFHALSCTNLKRSTLDKYKVSGRPGLPIFRLLQNPPQNWPFLTIFALL